jgi:hypothetical protein
MPGGAPRIDGVLAILHFIAVKKSLVDHTLAQSDRASVKELLSLSVRQPNVSGGTYGGRRQSRWLPWPTALLSLKQCPLAASRGLEFDACYVVRDDS